MVNARTTPRAANAAAELPSVANAAARRPERRPAGVGYDHPASTPNMNAGPPTFCQPLGLVLVFPTSTPNMNAGPPTFCQPLGLVVQTRPRLQMLVTINACARHTGTLPSTAHHHHHHGQACARHSGTPASTAHHHQCMCMSHRNTAFNCSSSSTSMIKHVHVTPEHRLQLLIVININDQACASHRLQMQSRVGR